MQTSLTFLNVHEDQAWEEIRGWLLRPAAELLHRFADESSGAGTAVEIGSFAGKSTICIARALEKRGVPNTVVCAIDIKFQPDFGDNLSRFGLAHRVRRWETSSLDAAEQWRQPVSFLYIDGHHGKAHAYADLLAWDGVILPGGIVALDDTIGFMLGPNLQLQAALLAGAYELLAEAGGVSFLRKRHSLVPAIGDFPLARGSLIAHLNYVSAWLGAMDPEFRLPRCPFQQPLRTAGRLRWLATTAWNANLRQLAGYLATRSRTPSRDSPAIGDNGDEPSARLKSLREPERVLSWIESQPNDQSPIVKTLAYLRACSEIRWSRLDRAIDLLSDLSRLDRSVLLVHYQIPIRELALLRLGQVYDLRGERELARARYGELVRETEIPEIRRCVEAGLAEPFRIPTSSNGLLLREYNLALARYRVAAAS